MYKMALIVLSLLVLAGVSLSQVALVDAAKGGNGNSNKPTSPKVRKPRPTSAQITQSGNVSYTGASRFFTLN